MKNSKSFLFSWFGTDFPADKIGQVIKLKGKKLKFLKRKRSKDDLIYELYEDVDTKEKWNCFYEEGYAYISMYPQSEWNHFKS